VWNKQKYYTRKILIIVIRLTDLTMAVEVIFVL